MRKKSPETTKVARFWELLQNAADQAQESQVAGRVVLGTATGGSYCRKYGSDVLRRRGSFPGNGKPQPEMAQT